jgi:hypothetical protein
MTHRISDQAMSMVKDCANALMDGRSFTVGEGPVLGALVGMAHDELKAHRTLVPVLKQIAQQWRAQNRIEPALLDLLAEQIRHG